MRCLERNKTKVYYANVIGRVPIMEDGYNTGQYELAYSEPEEIKAYVTSGTGNTNTELFGLNITYDKVMITENINLDIKESSIFWIDNTDVTESHDYIVSSIRKSLNSMSVALRKVKVD
jgi:hypothetical protein